MTGNEVHQILISYGVQHLHHANSVSTSLSLLSLGGLASRQLVENRELPQTHQYTDDIDKEYGIFGDVFMDTVDIHTRANNLNKYGPVLFVLTVDILLHLPLGSRVLITKLNPSKWWQTTTNAQRYFLTTQELASNINIGDFNQMLVIRTPDNIIPFNSHLQNILLDEPRLPNPQEGQEYRTARDALSQAALGSNINASISRRICRLNCKCTGSYANNASTIPTYFSLPE